MPFVSIKLLDHHGQERRDAIARRVTEAISETTGLPTDQVWVVFEGVSARDWYVAGQTVEDLRKSRK
jgi:4-oxalocrotonate tautomerase